MGVVLPFLVYAMIMFVVSYIFVEYGHKYLYDEVPPRVALKVALGALVMAAVLTWTRTSFETMFTADIHWTALLMLVWAGVFILIFQFQPLHGASLALVAALLVPGLATIAVQGVTTSRPDSSRQRAAPNKPYRKPMGGTPVPVAEEVKK